MKKCSSIDTDDMLYKLLRRAIDEKKIAINGVLCQETDRPADSQTEDIVVNTIAISHDKPQDGTSNVNIYVRGTILGLVVAYGDRINYDVFGLTVGRAVGLLA